MLLEQAPYEVPIQSLELWLKKHTGGYGQNQHGKVDFQPNAYLKCSHDSPGFRKYNVEAIEKQTLWLISCHHCRSETHTNGTCRKMADTDPLLSILVNVV